MAAGDEPGGAGARDDAAGSRRWDPYGERLEALLRHQARLLSDPADEAAFRRHILARPAPCARLNRLVPQAELVRPALRALGEAVPWCADAFVLHEAEQRLGHCLEFRLGALYIQAKATTLAVEALAPEPGDIVLDLAAAPGGKAIQMAGAMANTGVIVANELRSRRVAALVGNLERCGVHNAVVTRAPGTVLARYFHNCFDRILLDAPCSGDGILGKDRALLQYWSPEDAVRKAENQIGLLRAAFHMLRPGGILVYSTCSLSTEENEDVIMGLAHRYRERVRLLPVDGFEGEPLPPPVAQSYPADLACAARVWPHRHQTEGAVVFRLTKEGPTAWDGAEADLGPALRQAVPRTPEADALGAALEERWHLDLDAAGGREVVRENRSVYYRPAAAAALKDRFPQYVRAGMRRASAHRDHLYLAQQSVQLWGDRAGERGLEVTWDQVRTLFRGAPVRLDAETSRRGEVICRFGPWSVCRAHLDASGRLLEGYVPRALRTPDLER
ncbi:MAG: hypothetical protein ABIL09_19110, partial [Gemmatimonadota bacterium]